MEPLRRIGRLARVAALATLWSAAASAQTPPPDAPYATQVHDALRLRAPAFRRCFEQALRRDPALTGHPERMRFRVLASGRVRVVSVRMVPRSAPLERCMATVLAAMVLPPHRGGPYEFNVPLTE